MLHLFIQKYIKNRTIKNVWCLYNWVWPVFPVFSLNVSWQLSKRHLGSEHNTFLPEWYFSSICWWEEGLLRHVERLNLSLSFSVLPASPMEDLFNSLPPSQPPPPPPIRNSFIEPSSSSPYPRPARPSSGHDHFLLSPGEADPTYLWLLMRKKYQILLYLGCIGIWSLVWFTDTFIDQVNNSAPNPPVRRQTGDNMKMPFKAPQDYDQLPPTSGTKSKKGCYKARSKNNKYLNYSLCPYYSLLHLLYSTFSNDSGQSFYFWRN